jgi:TetR/AcrR family fatty acid metabolism transcriptional regulator
MTGSASGALTAPPRGERGRRGTFIEQARRAQIVRCAAEEIAENGYAAASMVAIARRAGVSRGVISYHFADRDDLVEQVIAGFYADAAAFIGPRMATAQDVRGQIATFIEANVAFLVEHPVAVRAASEIAANYRSTTGARLDQVRPEPAAGRAGLLALFEQGQASGELRAFNPYAMAVALRHAIDAAIAELDRTPEFDATAYARELVTAFDLAIRASRPDDARGTP